MNIALLIGQITISLLLSILILLQNSKGGLDVSVAGSEFRTKRGAEKLVFRATILCTVLFLLISIASIMR